MSHEYDNPFFYRSPIRDAAFFFGRQTETEQAFLLLKKSQSVAIVGPRRIGKTSLLLHLADSTMHAAFHLAADRYCFVVLDCQGWGSDTVGEVLSRLLEEATRALVQSGRQSASAPIASSISFRAFEQAIRGVVEQGIQLVFLLDEFEVLCANSRLDADLFSGLRSLAMRYGIAFATVSTRPLLELPEVGQGGLSSPFFNFFAQLRLYPFSLSEARTMLAELSTRGGWPFSNEAITLLLELAGPHPFLLQIAAFHTFAMLTQPGATLDSSHTEIRRRFLSDAESHWRVFWERLAPIDQRVLALLAVADRGDQVAVERLIGAGVVLRSGATAVPLSPAFAAFVERQLVTGLLKAPPITIDPTRRIALLHGQPLTLGPVEYALLVCLVERSGEIVSHSDIEQTVWGAPSGDGLKMALKALRRALGTDEDCIKNVRGMGYRFEPQ